MERPPMERALSTDVVMDIVLSHLKVEDLLRCRQVSKFWNKAASSVLRRRSTTVRNISEETVLMELQECMTTSSDFPFTGLRFGRPWRLQSAGAMRFLKNHGARFTRLSLGTSSKTRLQDIAPIINHFPRLSILEMNDPHGYLPPAELSDSAAGQEDDRILNLLSLRTLRISSELNEGVLREICTATSPSVRVECLRTSYGILRALKNVGKLQAVSVVNVHWNQRRKKLRVEELLSTDTPVLTKLDFVPNGCISRKGLIKLLVSSQHTLKELNLVDICPYKLLSECPVLAKLTTLSVFLGESYKYVFRGSHGHKFPALTELKLHADLEFPISDGLFIVPTVTRIDLVGYVRENVMKELAQIFPNVDTVSLEYFSYSASAESVETGGESYPSHIWNVGEFKQLEKLRICEFIVRRPTKNYINMDSFLTGIPLNMLQNLQKQKPEIMLNLIKSPFGESFREVLRVNPSILQLKNLKELVVYVRFQIKPEELPEDPPFMTMVSVWFALEMMPNLEAKFVVSYEFTELEEEEKHDAMVKAAFKQVQGYVNVELPKQNFTTRRVP